MYLSPRDKRILRRKQLMYNIFLSVQCTSMFLGAVYYYYKNSDKNEKMGLINIIGLTISIPSYMLWVLARFQLGLSFTYLPEASKLVKTGLYAIFSHPIYLFSGFAVFGYLLLLGNHTWLAVFVVLLPVQWLRARLEDKVLGDTFGREFELHRESVLF